MDVLSVIGIILAFAAIIGGNFLEGGSFSALVNLPAAIIVVGGTLAAAMLQSSPRVLSRALNMSVWIISPPQVMFQRGLDKVSNWAHSARRDGLLGLETLAETEPNRFARKGLQLLVDGNEPETIRNVMEAESLLIEQRDIDAAKFYESMGGYAPTIGIIGAVIGLIHVMGNLADPSRLGPGIAVAFVATIYGVGFANLILIPVAVKLKECVRTEARFRELLIEGIIAIADGENPKAIELKLSGYLR